MSQIDPWEKAAECARAIELSADRHRKAELTLIQHLWIALANEQAFLFQLALQPLALLDKNGKAHRTNSNSQVGEQRSDAGGSRGPFKPKLEVVSAFRRH